METIHSSKQAKKRKLDFCTRTAGYTTRTAGYTTGTVGYTSRLYQVREPGQQAIPLGQQSILGQQAIPAGYTKQFSSQRAKTAGCPSRLSKDSRLSQSTTEIQFLKALFRE